MSVRKANTARDTVVPHAKAAAHGPPPCRCDRAKVVVLG